MNGVRWKLHTAYPERSGILTSAPLWEILAEGRVEEVSAKVVPDLGRRPNPGLDPDLLTPLVVHQQHPEVLAQCLPSGPWASIQVHDPPTGLLDNMRILCPMAGLSRKRRMGEHITITLEERQHGQDQRYLLYLRRHPKKRPPAIKHSKTSLARSPMRMQTIYARRLLRQLLHNQQ